MVVPLGAGDIRFQELAKLHAKQRACFKATISRPNAVVLGGGSGYGGKSYMLRAWCVWLLLMYAAQGHPGQSVILATSTYEALRDRHMYYLNKEWGEWGTIKSNHKVHGRCFLFDNPAFGAIELRNIGEQAERKGAETAAMAVDELTEVTQAQFGEIAYRVRRPGLPYNPILAASNPDGIGFHWVKNLFRPNVYKQETGEVINEAARMAAYSTSVDPTGILNPLDYIYVPFLPDDNPTFNEKMFWRMVAFLPPHVQQARRWGRWDAPEGARWPMLREDVHLFEANSLWHGGVPEQFVKIIGCDYGLRNAYCCLWSAFDYDGNVYTYRCDYLAGLTADIQAQRILDKTLPNEIISDAYLDPAMWQKFPGHNPKPGQTEEPSAHDIYEQIICRDPRFPGSLTPGYNKSRVSALSTLDKLLNRNNGFPDWYIDVSCTALWTELANAVFVKGSEAKEQSEDIDKKTGDHAITAAYYGFHTHMKLPQVPPSPPTVQDFARLREEELAKKEAKLFAQFSKSTRSF